MPDQTHQITPPLVVGWREWVRCRSIGVPWIKAKIDTGARTSALHATGLEPYEKNRQRRIRFLVQPWQGNDTGEVGVDRPVFDERSVRSSSGHAEHRYVVQLPVVVAGRRVLAEVTLTERDQMGFRMLIGRQVLEQGFLVDSSRSYAGGRPKRVIRRMNRGR